MQDEIIHVRDITICDKRLEGNLRNEHDIDIIQEKPRGKIFTGKQCNKPHVASHGSAYEGTIGIIEINKLIVFTTD